MAEGSGRDQAGADDLAPSPPGASPPARVLIVEDHRAIAEALAIAFERNADLTVAAAVGTVHEAIDRAGNVHPDVILTDYHLPDGTGVDLANALRGRRGGPAIVMMTADESDEVLRHSLEAEVDGFVLKSASLAELAAVIRLAAEGEVAVPSALLTKVIGLQRERARLRDTRQVVASELTPRELEVLHLVCRGLDNRTIAGNLGVGVTTVRGHVQKILEKLGVHSKLGAMVRGTELGL